MKNFLKVLIVFAIFWGIFWYEIFYTKTPRILPALQSLSDIFLPETPCEEPIPYKIGVFTPEFKISKEYLLQAIKDAEAIWEEPFGRNLFSHEPENLEMEVLKINLTYDYRQQVTQKLSDLGTNVEANRENYDDMEAQVLDLKDRYFSEKNYFDKQVASFNERRRELEQEVAYWNSRGGAEESEYNRLEKERIGLNAEAKKLSELESSLNSLAEEINEQVTILNKLADSLNISVREYNNTAGVYKGETFEEGVYSSDGETRQIDIFEFSSREKLVRLLAHELGHALGIEHTEDPESIMYNLNQSKKLSLAEADKNALREVCSEILGD